MYGAQARDYFDADADADADADGRRVCVQQIGPDMDGFFASWEREVLPQLLQKYEAGVSPTLDALLSGASFTEVRRGKPS